MKSHCVVLLIAMNISHAFLMNGYMNRPRFVPSSQLDSHHSKDESRVTFDTAEWQKKLDEWSNSLNNFDYYEVKKAGDGIGSFIRDVVVDDWAKTLLDNVLAPEMVYPSAVNEPPPSPLDLELRRSNQRLYYKSLQQQLLEAEADLANLQARMAHTEPISYFE